MKRKLSWVQKIIVYVKLTSFGYQFFAMGLIFSLFFTDLNIFTEWTMNMRETQQVQGVVIQNTPTTVSANRIAIYQVDSKAEYE